MWETVGRANKADAAVIDLTNIEFLSDKLSVKQLRRVYPERFDLVSSIRDQQPRFFLDDINPKNAKKVIGRVMLLERRLITIGSQNRPKSIHMIEAEEELANLYHECGLVCSYEKGLEAAVSIREQAQTIGPQTKDIGI